MADIEELERRLSAALDRIGAGLDGIATDGGASAAEVQAMVEALDAEKDANAQLEERVRSLRERLTAAEAARDQMQGEVQRVRDEVQALRKTNQHLQSSLTSLREAGADGVVEPQLINQTMKSELEGLRAVREADRAELDEILVALKPHLQEGRNA